MAQVEHTTVSVRSDNRPQREGLYEYIAYSLSDRVRRGVVGCLGCWLVGAVVLPIPIVHLVVPPAMLILGPIVGFMRFRAELASQGVQVKCPVCDHDASVLLDASDRLPLYTYCPQCDGALHVVP